MGTFASMNQPPPSYDSAVPLFVFHVLKGRRNIVSVSKAANRLSLAYCCSYADAAAAAVCDGVAYVSPDKTNECQQHPVEQ